MFKKTVLLVIVTLFTLTACHSPVYNQTEANIADAKIDANRAIKKSNDTAKPEASLEVKQGDYVDTKPVSLSRKPSWLKKKIVIKGDQLPFSYYSRTIVKGGGNYILTKYQSALNPSLKVSMNYSGSIEGALDLLATRTGYVYSVNGNSVYWQAFLTKTFDVAFMPGQIEYYMGSAASSGGASSGADTAASGSGGSADFATGDGSASEYSNLKGILSLWGDLQTTIQQLLSPEGTVTVSQATTTVTVRDRPTNVRLVGNYIKNLNKNLAQQVLVKIQILEVDLSNDYSFGINWALIAKAFKNSPFKLNANYATPLAITALTTQTAGGLPNFGFDGDSTKTPSYNIFFNALNQQGKASVVSEPRVVCLNNQVSVVKITETEGYVASVENTAGVGGGGSTDTVTSTVTPGSVTTGLTLYILPKIMNNEVLMQVNADLSTNKGLKEFGSGSSTVQLPNVAAKHFNQRSRIKSGDTLILAGFRQIKNNANANQMLKSQALGGKGAAQESVETVVLITPIVLHGSA